MFTTDKVAAATDRQRSAFIHRHLSTILALALGVVIGLQFQEGSNTTFPPRSQGTLRRALEAAVSNSESSQMSSVEVGQVRDVHIPSQCRCGSGALAVPSIMTTDGHDIDVVQPPSKATGIHPKRFIHHPIQECKCIEGHPHAEPTSDMFLKQISAPWFDTRCGREGYINQQKSTWDQLPDLGVEELPLFAGVLSYEAPLSLNNTFHTWIGHDLFHRINARDVFVQLNRRSERDNAVMDVVQTKYEANGRSLPTVVGSETENLHPGLAIAKMCRMAEEHPSSHPNGENLLLFLEKDWTLVGDGPDVKLEELFRSVNAHAQRGVNFFRLMSRVNEVDESKTWKCPSQGVPWRCTTSHQHRWSNQPMIVKCDWF